MGRFTVLWNNLHGGKVEDSGMVCTVGRLAQWDGLHGGKVYTEGGYGVIRWNSVASR